MKKRPFDILSVGELLIDLISTEFAESLDVISNFKRLPGGSPANLCMNMARLGNNTKLVATVGNDNLGQYLKSFVQSLPIDCKDLMQCDLPTTLILVTRSKSTANFEAYRSADCQILPSQLSDTVLKNTSIFHTTCFALSQPPAKNTILVAARKAARFGCQLSIDANYAEKIWRNQQEAQRVIAEWCQLGTIIKISEVDWERLYGAPFEHPQTAIKSLLDLGASEVCLTLGENGCWVGNQKEVLFLPSRKVEVKDTTGAGDAFWAGYLTAYLDNHTLINKAKAGRKLAEMKLGYYGALPNHLEKTAIYQDFEDVSMNSKKT